MWGQIPQDDRFATQVALFNDSKGTPGLVRTAEALADDFGAIDDGDEGIRVNLAGIAAQLHCLATAQHAHNHRDALAREGAVATADRCRAVEMLDDKLLDLKGSEQMTVQTLRR